MGTRGTAGALGVGMSRTDDTRHENFLMGGEFAHYQVAADRRSDARDALHAVFGSADPAQVIESVRRALGPLPASEWPVDVYAETRGGRQAVARLYQDRGMILRPRRRGEAQLAAPLPLEEDRLLAAGWVVYRGVGQ